MTGSSDRHLGRNAKIGKPVCYDALTVIGTEENWQMTYKAKIYFEDEAPRIGCGWRRVTVKVGRKWARITFIDRTVRVKIKQLDALKPERI